MEEAHWVQEAEEERVRVEAWVDFRVEVRVTVWEEEGVISGKETEARVGSPSDTPSIEREVGVRESEEGRVSATLVAEPSPMF